MRSVIGDKILREWPYVRIRNYDVAWSNDVGKPVPKARQTGQ